MSFVSFVSRLTKNIIIGALERLSVFLQAKLVYTPHRGRSSWTPSRLRSRRWRTDTFCRWAAPGGTARAGWGRWAWWRARKRPQSRSGRRKAVAVKDVLQIPIIRNSLKDMKHVTKFATESGNLWVAWKQFKLYEKFSTAKIRIITSWRGGGGKAAGGIHRERCQVATRVYLK